MVMFKSKVVGAEQIESDAIPFNGGKGFNY